MATTAPQTGYSEQDISGSNIDARLAAGDIEGARAEFERLCLESLDSGEPVAMTTEKWEQFRLDLHRKASRSS